MKFVVLALSLVAADHPMVCEPVESDGGTATGRVLRACEAALREERDKTFACEKALAEYRPARLFCPVCGRRCDEFDRDARVAEEIADRPRKKRNRQ